MWRGIGYAILIILLYPFILALTSVVIMPYALQRCATTGGAKAGLVALGILLGLILTPFFIVFAVLYTLFWLLMELLDLCGCQDCNCMEVSHHEYFQR